MAQNLDATLTMRGEKEMEEKGITLMYSTERTGVAAKCIVLLAAVVAVLTVMVLVFAGFVGTSLLGLHPWPPWNNYLFFVLSEICMSLAFGALFQGLLLVWPRRAGISKGE